MKRPLSLQRRGSALVFVLIIIAGIVTVTIGTQRLSLVQFNQATREEDNLFAYYAAKAGLEDGLLRFRYQRDVETSVDKVFRFDVTGGVAAGEVNVGAINQGNPQGFDYETNHQYYDLSIDFRDKAIGTFNLNEFGDNKTLVEGDELQLTGFPNPTNYQNSIYLRYAFEFVGENCNDRGAFVQIEQISDVNGSTVLAQHQARIPLVGARVDSSESSQNLEIKTNTSYATYVRLRPYHCGVKYAFAATTTPNGPGNEPNDPEFDSLLTKITATGYYGKAKRTLQAQVDRKSGTLLNIYDFSLYSGEGSIVP